MCGNGCGGFGAARGSEGVRWVVGRRDGTVWMSVLDGPLCLVWMVWVCGVVVRIPQGASRQPHTKCVCVIVEHAIE